MKTLPVLLVTCLLFVFTSLRGQDCNDLENWGKMLEAEFPDVNMSGIRSGSRESNRMVFNLYSDKFFVPVSGKPFDQLSAGARAAKGTKVRRGERKTTALQSGTHLWMNYVGTAPLGNGREAELVIKAVVEIRALRKRYAGIMNDLGSGDVEYNEVQRLKRVASQEFALLLPSEINQLLDALKTVGSEVADKSLLAKANMLNGDIPSPTLSHRLANFANANAILYKAATPAGRSAADDIIRANLDQTLAEIFVLERAKLDAISLTDPDALKNCLTLEQRIRTTYNRLLNNTHVKAFFKDLTDRKTTYVAGQRKVFESEIASATNEKMLGDLINFLAKLETGNSDVQALQQQADQRLTVVRLQAQRKKQASQLAENKRQQAAVQEARARGAVAKENKQKVAALRNQLRLNYGVNLPTIEQLFYVKAYGSPIKGRPSDATKNQFINYVENMGYMLENQDRKLYADNNRFKNRLGYRLATSRIIGKNGKSQFYAANLVIENAPRDLIELYHLELTTQYRPIDALRKQPFAGTPVGDFESNTYVESGGTLYSVQVDEGNLVVTAFDNLDATFDVMAGESSPGTLEITGFTDKTHLTLVPGEKVSLKASGSISLGVFAGTSGPAGVAGFRAYNVVSGLPHGALIGRFGSGKWFLVGNGGIFSAPQGGTLRLIINDKDRRNNEGSYLVGY
jgi:hypothetical protein